MNLNLVLGLQFGDEGKGKFVDYLSKNADFIVRSNGGNNAGHTVVVGKNKYAFSMLPSGALYKKPILIAQGCVINPQVLLNEINVVEEHAGPIDLRIDPRCHVIMPYHILLDEATEQYKGENKMGSLKLGVGYCYEDKTNRAGIRMIDLLDKQVLAERINQIWDIKKSRIQDGYKHPFNLDKETIIAEYLDFGQQLKKYIKPVSEELIVAEESKNVLVETSQANYLDYSFGTYPYTVAYNTIASSSLSDIGLPPQSIEVLGVLRAYTIRVGNGPFPTEEHSEIGNFLRECGNEYGTVSKRPRRCGWLDLVMAKYSCRLNGVKEIAVTKLDVLSGLSELKVCVGYEVNGIVVETFNPVDSPLDKVRPIYQTLAGWKDDISKINSFDELPAECQKYVEFIESYLEVKAKFLSVGPEREQVIIR